MKSKIIFFLLLLPILLQAQFNGINYKSIIYNNGVVAANQSVTLRFTYFQNNVEICQETFATTTSNAGIVIVNMGEGTAVSGSLDNVDFSSTVSYKVEVDLGSGYSDMGTFDFKSVPFAINAGTANNLSAPLSINGLSDGKTDATSLFLGNNTGILDDGNNNNVAIGQNCFISNTTGYKNVGLGAYALNTNSGGLGNTAVGYYSMKQNSTGSYNTSLGYLSMETNLTGSWNVAVGINAMRNNTDGDNNVAIGYQAGYNATGNDNVFIGHNAGYSETGDDKLYIDNTTTNTPLIKGDFSTNELTVNGSLAIKDGTQGTGKVFTSDDTGKGSWQTYSRSHRLRLSPADVQLPANNVSYYKSMERFYISSSSVASVILPIDLPAGAHITSVNVYYKHSVVTHAIRFRIYKTYYSYSQDPVSTLIDYYTAGTGGAILYTVNHDFSIDETVGNYENYYIVIDGNDASWPGNDTVQFNGAIITYTY